MENMPFLGEIVIAPEIARNQALSHGTSTEKELGKLIIHGILHLLGYDHENDKGEMSRLQKKLLRHCLPKNSLLMMETTGK